jgi:hypothetical protein
MPITNNSYNTRSGEMVYTISAEVGAEEFKLAVTPKDRNRNQLTFWQGDRYDENNFLVAQSDPIRLEYEGAREDFYRIVESVFGPKPWVREALTSIARVHPKRVEEELEAIKQKSAEDPEIKALRGHEPTIFRTPEGYRMEAPGGVKLIPLSNFTGRIIEDVIVDDGSGEVDRFFLVEAVLNGRRHRFEVSSQDFDGLRWVPKHLGALAGTEGQGVRSLVANAIRLESVEGLKEVHAYGHTGWLELNDRWAYLHAGGAITGVGAPPFESRIVLSGKLSRRRFPSPSSADPEELKHAVAQALALWDLAADEISIPLMLSAYRAAVGEVDYGLHLAGPTGLGKTELARLAVSHFGAGLGPRDQTNFESTAYSIEREAFAIKDQLLLLDDYLGTPEHRRILAFIARSAANRSGRARLASDGTLRGDKPPRALVITTGEDVPVGESLTARMLIIRVPEGSGLDLSPGAPINAAQAAAREGRHALAMAGFINWLAPRYDEISSALEARRNRLGHQVRPIASHSRTPGIYGDLMIGLEKWMGFAREIGAIDEQQAAALEEKARMAVMAAIREQGEYLESADPVERYRDLLREAISSGKAHVRALGEEPGPGVHLGWLFADGTYLYPAVSLNLAKDMAQAVGDPLPFSGQAMNRRLLERGWLVSTNLEQKRKSIPVRKKVEGRTETVLHLKPEFLEDG